MEIIDAIPVIFPLIQYLAMILTCTGYYFVGSKRAVVRKIGFAFGVIGNITWIIYGTNPLQPAIILTNLFIFALGVRGYYNNSDKTDPELLKYMRENDLLMDEMGKKE
jgi:hypothetical protein